jgi:hypothetical protein
MRTKYYLLFSLELVLVCAGVIIITVHDWTTGLGILFIYISFQIGSLARDSIRDKISDLKIKKAKNEAKFEFFQGRIKKAVEE